MPETVLDLTTRVHMEPLTAGMADAVSTINSSVGSMLSDFAKLAGGTKGSLDIIQSDLGDLKAGFAELQATVGEAMTQMRNHVVTSSEESGFALGELKRELGEVAESAELSATGAVSAFGPLGAIFGAGMFTHYLEETKEVALRTERLSNLTGISVAQLTELRAGMEELGVPTENLSRLLLHLAMEMQEAADGDREASESFHQLGLATDTWRQKLPSTLDVLMQISDHMHAFKGNTDDAAATAHVFGQRLGIDMAGGVAAGSKAIQELMEKNRGLGQAMSDSTEAANRMQQAEAEMAAKIQADILPLLGFFADFITTSRLLFVTLKDEVVEIADIIGAVFETIGASLIGVDTAMGLAMTGHFHAAAEEMRRESGIIENAWHQVAERIRGDNKEISDAMSDITRTVPVPKQGQGVLGGTHEQSAGQSMFSQFQEELEDMRARADAFHGLTLEQERAFWSSKLAVIDGGVRAERAALQEEIQNASRRAAAATTPDAHQQATAEMQAYQQRLTSLAQAGGKDREEVQRQLNTVLHKMALESFQERIALDQEFISASARGSAERLAAVEKERDDVVRAYGESSKQAMAVNRKVFEEQMADGHIAAENVVKSTDQQIEQYKRGAKVRVDTMAAALAQLKTMEDNLHAGRTAAGAPETSAPLGPTAQSDSQLRIAMRKTEADQIAAIVAQMEAKIAEEYRSETEEANREALKRENRRLAETSKDLAATLSAARQSLQEQISQIEQLASYDLISFNKKMALIRQLVEAEHEKASAAIEAAADEALAEEAAAKTDEQREAALQRITELLRLQARLDEEYAQRQMQLNDQVANREIARASAIGNVIASSFSNAFDRMLTAPITFGQAMQNMWNSILQGFARMTIQMIAGWIRALATMAAQALLSEMHITTTHQQATAARAAATQAGVAEESAAKQSGDAENTGSEIAQTLKSIGRAAATAAAHAFKWVMQEVPFPANVALAPAVAAAAFAGVMAFDTIASAAGGMEVPHDMLAMVHQNEMVLPATLSGGIKSLITGGGVSSGAGANRSVTNNMEMHYHSHGSPGIQREELPALISDAVRRGSLG